MSKASATGRRARPKKSRVPVVIGYGQLVFRDSASDLGALWDAADAKARDLGLGARGRQEAPRVEKTSGAIRIPAPGASSTWLGLVEARSPQAGFLYPFMHLRIVFQRYPLPRGRRNASGRSREWRREADSARVSLPKLSRISRHQQWQARRSFRLISIPSAWH